MESKPALITDLFDIFKPELVILEGNLKDFHIQVVCNQAAPEFDYCGGELCFQAQSVQVVDEGGHHYRIDELGSLCKNYWEDWSTKRR